MCSNSLIGIGLRQPHYKQVLEELPSIGWFEVHSENFFQFNGAAINLLSSVRQHYPVSLHGVGLSLGAARGIEDNHLLKLKQLIDIIQPCLISEHLSWGQVGNYHLPDLLPIPYTQESLDIFCRNVNQVQEFLGREILIENPSSYLEYQVSELTEADFLSQLCIRTGAKILLDINNIFVSSENNNWHAQNYIDLIPRDLVKEIHLSGHSTQQITSEKLLRIDTHDNHVCQEVWQLYDYALKKFGPTKTLLEWDAKIPTLSILINEAQKVQQYFNNITPKASYENS
jgi:uncharacterized protein (UPF0276 family)